ncbi:MAG: NnrU family protein [Pseudomonadota bacterium]
MFLLILGLILWTAVHFWKRIAPDHRAKFGDPGKGIVAGGIAVSILLMIFGYRAWDGTVFWGRSSALVGINNLLIVIGFYIYSTGAPGPGKPRARLGRMLRHPQLIGFSLWAIAHLIVNGDTPSFVLFGWLLAWAVVTMIVINRAEPDWTPAPAGDAKKEIVPVVATVVMVAVIGGIHYWLGYNPSG